MSENVTTTPAVDAAEATKAFLLGLYKSQVEEANKHAERVANSSTNIGKLVQDLREDENTQDEKIKEFQTWVEKIDATREAGVSKINEYIATLIPKNDIDVDAEKAAYGDLKDQISGASQVLKSMHVEIPEDYPTLKNLRGGNTGAGGSSGPKPRVGLVTVNGEAIQKEVKVKKNGKETGETKLSSNFTLAAQHLSKASGTKVEAADLQSATFEAAGTTDLKSLPAGHEISFSFSAGDKNYNVSVFTQDAK